MMGSTRFRPFQQFFESADLEMHVRNEFRKNISPKKTRYGVENSEQGQQGDHLNHNEM